VRLLLERQRVQPSQVTTTNIGTFEHKFGSRIYPDSTAKAHEKVVFIKVPAPPATTHSVCAQGSFGGITLDCSEPLREISIQQALNQSNVI
jgi:hypothetical protein